MPLEPYPISSGGEPDPVTTEAPTPGDASTRGGTGRGGQVRDNGRPPRHTTTYRSQVTTTPGGTVDRTALPDRRGPLPTVTRTFAPPTTIKAPPVTPTPPPPSPISPAPSDVTRSAVQRTTTVHGASAVIATIYGKINIGGQLVYRIVNGGKLICVFVIGHGPISQVLGATVNLNNVTGVASPVSFYTGTKSQSVDTTVSAAEPGWVSGLPGRAYAVIGYTPPSDTTPQFDPYSIVFEVEGLLIRDGRNNPPPTDVPVAATGSSGAPVGRYLWKFTYVDTAGDESPGSPSSAPLTLASERASLSGITAGPGGTTARKIYRTKAGTDGPFYLAGTISDNSTTTFTDNTADGSLGAEIPYVSTKRVYSNNPAWVIADYLASKRYGAAKGDAAIDWLGSFKDAADICDVAIEATGGAAPTASVTAGSGSLGAGTYSYKYAYVTATLGESIASAKSNTITVSAGDRATVTGIVAGPTGTRFIRLFRTAAGNGAAGPWKTIELLPASTTSWTDGRPDSDLGAEPLTTGTVARYTINVALQDRLDPQQVLEQLRGCCAGYLVFNDGLHKLYIDVAKAVATQYSGGPPLSFTDDPDDPARNITKPPTFRLRNLSEVPSKVVVNFTNALNGYVDDSAEDEEPGFVADYDSRVVKTYDDRGISTYDQAKRIAGLLRRRAKFCDVEVAARVLYDGRQVLPFDRIPIDSVLGGVTGKSWLITNVQQDGIATILQGELYSDLAYDDSLAAAPPPSAAAGSSAGGVVIRIESSGAAATTFTPTAGAPLYRESTTTPDGATKTFAFSTPIGTLITAFIGGQAQRPADCSVSSGDLVFGASVAAPEADEKVTALYL